MAWTNGLAPWYATNGRHDLPWRHTCDPWAVLVSEVMLQQTQVVRVLPYWSAFMQHWPTPAECAAASLQELLREWQGLGYPRRAVALHDTAAVVAANGWPRDEAGLRLLPGVGAYTARALLTLALALEEPSPAPLDVNIARVAARAARGVEPGEAAARALETSIDAARPRTLDRRHYTFALFDVAALHCHARPRCEGCPLRRTCASRARLAQAPAPASGLARRPGIPYASSMRRLRGVLLAAALANGGDLSRAAARRAARAAASDLALAAQPEAVDAALGSLRADRLIGRPAAAPSN